MFLLLCSDDFLIWYYQGLQNPILEFLEIHSTTVLCIFVLFTIVLLVVFFLGYIRNNKTI